jgi:Na+/melibiose symporter-like transporter
MLLGLPLYCLGFLLPFWKFGDGNSITGLLHFCGSLFIWDAAFTWVLIGHCALLPELTTITKERGNISVWVSVTSLLGSLVIFPTYPLFSDLGNFRLYCVGVAVISLILMSYACIKLSNLRITISTIREKNDQEMTSFWKFFWDLITMRNFVVFVIVNFLNIFTQSLFDSFKVSYLKHNLEEFLGKGISAYFTICSLLPMILAIATSAFSIFESTHNLLWLTFVSRIGLSLFSLIFIDWMGAFVHVVFLLFTLSALGAVGTLLTLALALVVDEDHVMKKRANSMSSSVYGINALLTKPALSVAPSLGTYYLKKYGYGENTISPDLGIGLFKLLVWGNLISAVLQVIVWSKNTLRGKYLERVKKEISR